MEDRETARMRIYGESKTTRIMMATVQHVISGLGLRKFQADGFFLTRVYLLVLLAGRTRCRDGNFSTACIRIFMNTHKWRPYLVQHVWHETYAIFDSHSNYMRSSTDAHPHTHVHTGYFV